MKVLSSTPPIHTWSTVAASCADSLPAIRSSRRPRACCLRSNCCVSLQMAVKKSEWAVGEEADDLHPRPQVRLHSCISFKHVLKPPAAHLLCSLAAPAIAASFPSTTCSSALRADSLARGLCAKVKPGVTSDGHPSAIPSSYKDIYHSNHSILFIPYQDLSSSPHTWPQPLLAHAALRGCLTDSRVSLRSAVQMG